MAERYGCDLTKGQEDALIALITEPSVAAAAAKANIGERTIHRWLREDEAFAAEYRRVRREAFTQAVGLTQRSATAAVATLLRIMHDPKATWSSRVSCGHPRAQVRREGIELDDIAARVETLEATVAEHPQ